MGSNNKNSVGINSFVKRQIKGSGKTYSILSFEEIRHHAEVQLAKGQFSKGYRDGVILVKVNKKLTTSFISPMIKINMNTKFETKPKKRRDNENIYLSTKALNGKPLVLGSVDLILYRNDVLKETNEDETNCEWELIAFYGIPKCLSERPMGPVTMMRNQLCLPGGTKGEYSSEEWADSVNFWQTYALLKEEI